MKGTQREQTVAHAAGHELRNMLDRRFGPGSARCWTECKVKPSSKRFRGRADLVVAAVTEDDSIYTVCVEAKSLRTFRSIQGQGGCVPQFALAGAVGGTLGATAWWHIDGTWGVGAFTVTFLLTGLAILWVVERWRLFFTRAPVLDQVLRYPGNERWLAIAQDALGKSRGAFDDLLIDCRKEGFGLLGVTRRRAPIIHLEAVHSRDPGDIFSEYVREDEMRRELDASARRATRIGAPSTVSP